MTEGYRKAALKLHSMNAADRDWMLEQLKGEERAALVSLLAELKELGIKSFPSIEHELSTSEVKENFLGELNEEIAGSLDLLCTADPSEIFSMFSHEPDLAVATVLSAYPWPWKSQLLASYGVENRLRLGRTLSEASLLKPKLRFELIRLLAEQLKNRRMQQSLHDGSIVRKEKNNNVGNEQKKSFLRRLQQWLS